MTVIIAIIKFLTGGFLDTLAKAYVVRVQADTDRFKVGAEADQAIILKQLDAEIEARKIAAASRAADRGSIWTAWQMPIGFTLPTAAHYWAVVLDSMPWFGHRVGSWEIPTLPGKFGEYEGAIIMAVIGVVGLTKAVRLWR